MFSKKIGIIFAFLILLSYSEKTSAATKQEVIESFQIASIKELYEVPLFFSENSFYLYEAFSVSDIIRTEALAGVLIYRPINLSVFGGYSLVDIGGDLIPMVPIGLTANVKSIDTKIITGVVRNSNAVDYAPDSEYDVDGYRGGQVRYYPFFKTDNELIKDLKFILDLVSDADVKDVTQYRNKLKYRVTDQCELGFNFSEYRDLSLKLYSGNIKIEQIRLAGGNCYAVKDVDGELQRLTVKDVTTDSFNGDYQETFFVKAEYLIWDIRNDKEDGEMFLGISYTEIDGFGVIFGLSGKGQGLSGPAGIASIFMGYNYTYSNDIMDDKSATNSEFPIFITCSLGIGF